MSRIIMWENPPPREMSGRRKGWENDKLVTELQASPGRWAKVGEAVSPTLRIALAKRGCEAVSRRVPDVDGRKRWDVWARWPEVSDES